MKKRRLCYRRYHLMRPPHVQTQSVKERCEAIWAAPLRDANRLNGWSLGPPKNVGFYYELGHLCRIPGRRA